MRTKTIITLIIVLVVMAICAESANAVDHGVHWVSDSLRGSDHTITVYHQMCALDGSNQGLCWLYNPGYTVGLALDIVRGKTYWTDQSLGYICRSELDSCGNKEIPLISGLNNPTDIEVDLFDSKIYWIESASTMTIKKANLDGTNIQTVLSQPSVQCWGLALDPIRKKIYWTNTGPTTATTAIYRANIDGTGIEMVIPATYGYQQTGISIDPYRGKMYWIDKSCAEIRRANLDGSSPELLLNVSDIWAIDVDVIGEKLYWTSTTSHSLTRSNLDGSDATVIGSPGPGSYTDIEVIGTPASLTMGVAPIEGGTTIPGTGPTDIEVGVPTSITAQNNVGYVFNGWTANPPTNALFADANSPSTTVAIWNNTTVTANFSQLPQYELTMAVSPSAGGITTPSVGTTLVFQGIPNPINAQANAGYVFNGWTASPAGNVIFGDSNSPSTAVTLSDNATVTANFLPLVDLTMVAQPPEGGTTTPPVGTSSVEHGLAKPIEAHANAGYVFNIWTASPAENVIFGNANAPSTTATLSGNATVTAIFNAKPVADINATVNVLVITDANSVTLDATGSTDDGLPNPPGIMTYHWEKVTGPNTCNILDPNIAVTDVLFWGLGSYEFSVTVSDGQLQDVKSVTIDVVVEVAYIANNGDDNTGLGTIENPFATIQKGINTVQDNGTVIVMAGIYHENIDFGGKKILVKSADPDNQSVVANTIIDANGSGSVVVFDSGEDANSVLAGFTITGGNTTLGGGIYINEVSPVVEKNVITGNSASSEGGGIYCQGGSATIRYNEISNNYSGFAGGVSFESSFAVLQNNLIVDNSADCDSGVACVEGQPRIVNNTIAGNVAVYDYDSSGLVIASSSLSPIISNNIIAFNYGAPGVVDFGGFDPNYFSYNDVYGHPNGDYLSWVLPAMDQTGVNGNISVNPLFADTDANDYHLLPESLLIDAGDLSSDWSKEPRPNGGRINMGAYGNTSEASCSVAGDITWDKKVDFKDFAKLAFYWLQNEPSVDIAPLVSGDNIVDVGDLAVLAEHWLEGSAP